MAKKLKNRNFVGFDSFEGLQEDWFGTWMPKNFFDQIDLPVQLVHLSGSVELGPITGMAEAIVDLVATGRTLRDNGLVEIEELFKSSARLVGHPLSLRLDKGPLQEIIDSIQIQSQTNLLSDGKK